MENKITAYCRIHKGEVWCNGKLRYANTEEHDHLQFLHKTYRHFKPEYPKFFKMDSLSKLAFLASYFLLLDSDFDQSVQHPNTGVLINNSSASITVDRLYQISTNDFPAPSLFVYTLPNVMVGEICIRYKIFGENTVFISEFFEPEQLLKMINSIDSEGNTTEFIAGYVNDDGVASDVFFMLIEKNKIGFAFDLETIWKLYRSSQL